jgi:hypothetical protein
MSGKMKIDSNRRLGKYMGYPFAGGDYSFGLGLAPMREEEWLDIDDRYRIEMAEKARRLREEYDAVFLALPGSEAGQSEVLELLLRHLTAYYPDRFRVSDRVENLINGETWRVEDFADAPLDLAGRLVQEDLCLMSPGADGAYRLSAGSLCFPFRWELRDKIGLPMTAVHGPVPGYEEKLAGPADRFMAALKAHRPSWRCNWNVVDAPDLYLRVDTDPQERAAGITAENAGARLWIRCERQTLRKLPGSGDVLFTIRTYIRPLSVLEGMPEVAKGLARALEQVPHAMRVYKSQVAIRGALTGYLDRIGAR